jgi:predicted Fe-Mo cluster-binding NifX family protein
MNNKSIKFAFAVDNNGLFQSKHFGNAEKYLIYEWKDDELFYKNDISNICKSLDEEGHGLIKKGMAIVEMLKNIGINVLVSKRFGENIKIVNRHFIPVIIYNEKPEEAIHVLKRHIKWIEDELDNSSEKYKLFYLKQGALKTTI